MPVLEFETDDVIIDELIPLLLLTVLFALDCAEPVSVFFIILDILDMRIWLLPVMFV